MKQEKRLSVPTFAYSCYRKGGIRTLFTDWIGYHSTRYYYARGALFGAMLTVYLIYWGVPALRSLIHRLKEKFNASR